MEEVPIEVQSLGCLHGTRSHDSRGASMPCPWDMGLLVSSTWQCSSGYPEYKFIILEYLFRVYSDHRLWRNLSREMKIERELHFFPLYLLIFSFTFFFPYILPSLFFPYFMEWPVQCQVCGVSLTENVVEIIFHVFDANRDGSLSSDEFIRVLHKRERDIAQPTEAGLLDFLLCCWNCGNNCSIARFLA